LHGSALIGSSRKLGIRKLGLWRFLSKDDRDEQQNGYEDSFYLDISFGLLGNFGGRILAEKRRGM